MPGRSGGSPRDDAQMERWTGWELFVRSRTDCFNAGRSFALPILLSFLIQLIVNRGRFRSGHLWPSPKVAVGEVRLRPWYPCGPSGCFVRPEVSFLTFIPSISNNYIGKKGKRLNAAETIFARERPVWFEERYLSLFEEMSIRAFAFAIFDF